jgi:hypothetical protein
LAAEALAVAALHLHLQMPVAGAALVNTLSSSSTHALPL